MGAGLYAQYARGINPLEMVTNLTNLQRSQFALQQARLQPAEAGLNALLEQPNVSWGDVAESLSRSQRLGGDISGMMQNLNAAAARGENPADFIKQQGTGRYVPSFEAAQLFGPQYMEVPTASGTMFMQRSGPFSQSPNQLMGQPGFVAKGVSPEQWAAPTPYAYDPQTGQVYTKPWGEIYGNAPGMGGVTGGGAPAPSGGVQAGEMGAGDPRFGAATGIATQGGNAAMAASPAMATGGMSSMGAATKQGALFNIMMRESHGQNVPNAEGGSASGFFQIIPSTWQHGQQLAGIPPDQQTATAIKAPFRQQYAVASALFDEQGERPWQASAANAGRYPGYQEIEAVRGMGAQGGAQVMPAAYTPGGDEYTREYPTAGGGGGFSLPSAPGAGGGAPGPALPPGAVPLFQGGGYAQRGIPPGTIEQAQTAAAGAGQRMQDLMRQQYAAPQQIALLQQLQSDLAGMPITGASSAVLNHLHQLAVNWGIHPPGIDVTNAAASQDSFNKVTSQLSAAQMGVLGGPSDARQDLSQHMNPSGQNTKEGNERVIDMLIGNQNAIQTMTNEWVGSRQSPAQFDRWRIEEFNAPHDFTSEGKTYSGRFDPRVFWMANMTLPEQQQYLQTFKGTAATQLQDNIRYGVSKGWVNIGSNGALAVTP